MNDLQELEGLLPQVSSASESLMNKYDEDGKDKLQELEDRLFALANGFGSDRAGADSTKDGLRSLVQRQKKASNALYNATRKGEQAEPSLLASIKSNEKKIKVWMSIMLHIRSHSGA